MNRSQKMMLTVLMCLLPGAATSVWILGFGVLQNLLIGIATVMVVELLVLKVRNKPLQPAVDGSGTVTAVLLCLILPPELPWYLVVFGSSFAILLGKHLYGGLGHNPFNPAMVGYCALIVSFPLAMSTWPPLVDGLSGATPLDAFKWRGSLTVEEFWQPENGFSHLGGVGYAWISIAYLAGGVILLAVRAAPWQTPLAFIGTLSLLAVLFYDSGSSDSLGSPLLHVVSGGTLFAAFFVLTDPVTTPTTSSGLVYFGIGTAFITFIIRSIGAYPDGIAFAVLLMNALVPLYEQLQLRLAR